MLRVVAALLALLLCAQSPIQSFPPGLFTSRAALSGGGGAAYQGIGDTLTNIVAGWSLSAFSAATRGTKAANVCNSTGGVDVACADLLSDASTGALVPQSIAGVTCPGNANCTVKTLYDQTGLNSCSGSPCDLTKPTVAVRPVLNSTIGTRTCMSFIAASTQELNTGTGVFFAGTFAQPWSMIAVGQKTSSATTSVLLSFNVPPYIAFNNVANQAAVNAGTKVGFTASDAAPHVLGFVANGASSVASTDGSNSTVSAGTNVLPASTQIFTGQASGASANAVLCEMAISSTDQSANFSALSTARRSFWGF